MMQKVKEIKQYLVSVATDDAKRDTDAAGLWDAGTTEGCIGLSVGRRRICHMVFRQRENV